MTRPVEQESRRVVEPEHHANLDLTTRLDLATSLDLAASLDVGAPARRLGPHLVRS